MNLLLAAPFFLSGELWGLSMALQMTKERVLSHPDHYNHLYIFTDSQFSLGIVTDGWRSRSHPDLAMKLKLLVRHFPIPTTIAWVPAHCGIDSNERADELADSGAITSGKVAGFPAELLLVIMIEKVNAVRLPPLSGVGGRGGGQSYVPHW